MQFAIFTLIVCVFVVGAFAESEKFKKLMEKCTDLVGADPELVKAAHENQDTQDFKVKCVLACTLKEEGSMNDKGEVDKENMIKTLPTDIPEELQDVLKEAINDCADERGEDECETAYVIYSCIQAKLGSSKEE